MNRKSYSQILDSVARDRMAEGTDLAPRILARIQKGKHRTMQPRTKVFATVFLILLVLLIVSIGVPAVRAAIQRWIGYVPGVGLVSEGQIRVLEEPVSVTQNGLKLRVKEVMASSTQMMILYSVEGITADMLSNEPMDDRCNEPAILRWPDGEFRYGREMTGFNANGEGYESQIYYPALPATVNDATLVIPCLPSTLPGKAPGNWEISFRLIPAPPELTALPVIEIGTPIEATAVPLTTDPHANPLVEGIFLTMDRAVQLEEEYLIYATLHWENMSFGAFDVLSLRLLDANGQEISTTNDIDAVASVPYEQGKTVIAVRTGPIPTPGPLTLVVDSIHLTMGVDAGFMFDPGPDPQPGQVWELNEDVDLGYGYSLRVLRATYPKDSPQPGFSFDMESDTGVSSAILLDMEHPLAEDTGLGGYIFAKSFSDDFYYTGAMPEGPIEVTVLSVAANLSSHWEAQWTPPALEVPSTPTIPPLLRGQTNACFTRERWEQALQQPASLPADLGGRLAFFDLTSVTDKHKYRMAVTQLDGKNRTAIGPGVAPSLSPDGKRVVHAGTVIDGPPDGLYITDLVSGTTTRLPGTARGDFDPLWSPDGQKIAFTRGTSSGLVGEPGPYNIVVMNPDGSDFQFITQGNQVNYAMDWMPDGKHLLYTVDGADNRSIQIIDIQTGKVTFLFEAGLDTSIEVSPDGKRLAIVEKLYPEVFGLFVSNLDGSNRKLLSNGDPYAVTMPVWSPDGNWIIASLLDPFQERGPVLTLIQVDTCQIIPVRDLSGYVTSWIP